MFEKVPADLLIRFLSENDTVADSLKVMGTLGNMELAAAATAVSRRRQQAPATRVTLDLLSLRKRLGMKGLKLAA